MSVEPYRRVLSLPGVRALLLVGLFARIPITASGITMTLYVVNEMRLGFFEAGLVGSAITLGVALGSPVAGRCVDRFGLRPVVAVTTAAQFAFWLSAGFLPYWALLAAAIAGGVLALPVFSVVRQCLATAVPEAQRRTAFSLDGMFVEISYMVGPATAVAAVTAVGAHWTIAAIGVGMVGSGIALYVLDPPTRSAAEKAAALPAVPRRRWFTPALLGLLGLTFAVTFVLTATELGIVAALKDQDAQNWTGLVIGLWCAWSLVGGFVYGALSRGVSPLVIVAWMAALTVPVGLLGPFPWPWLVVALIPAGILCAPALSAGVDQLSRWVPASARGEAMGLHGAALTLGLAASGPVAGSVIDAHGPSWAFVTAGAVGLALVGLAAPFWRRAPATAPPEPAERVPV